MRTLLVLFFLLFPITVLAADPPTMNQGNMQNMMQSMQQMQKCMEQVDQAQLQEIQVSSEKVSKEVEALCAAGKRDEAQRKAITFAREIVKNPAMKQMRKCGEMMQGTMPMLEGIDDFDERKYEETHVCDQ